MKQCFTMVLCSVLHGHNPTEVDQVLWTLQDMPGGGNKFVVRKDNVPGLYIALSNPQTLDANGNDQRNLLQLVSSPDLTTW